MSSGVGRRKTRSTWNPSNGLGIGCEGRYAAGKWAIESMLGEQFDEFDFGVRLFVLGFRFGLRPTEFADLLTNFIGWDMMNDNRRLEPLFGGRWLTLGRPREGQRDTE